MERCFCTVAGLLFGFLCCVSCQGKPSLPTHNCPASVIEGGDVTCRCVLSDVGQPPATVHWQQTGSASLVLNNLSCHDNGRVFTCLVVWNGSHVYSVNYTLSVASNTSVALLWGVGIGLGAGLALMTIVAAVLAVVLWRKGWVVVLPCAGQKRHQYENWNETGQCDVTPDSLTDSQRPLPAEGDTEESQPWSEGQYSVYDKVDESLIPAGNSYQALKVNRTNPFQKQRLIGTQRKEAPSRSHGNEAAVAETRKAIATSVPVKVKRSRKQTKKKTKFAVSETDFNENSEDLIYNNLCIN